MFTIHFSRSRRRVSALVAFVALAVRGAAPLDAQSPTFKSGVDMVPLTVTVTDPTGKYVTGLTGNDFSVFENGVEQPLSFFANENVPLDLALVLDTSGSMQAELPLVRSAASGLARQLRPCDRGAVVEVKNFARIPQPFTSDRALIDRAINGLSTSGETALYDALLCRAPRIRARASRERSGQTAGARPAVGWPGHQEPSFVRRRDGSRASS
jgi:Ca-activated chloride channel homolog